MVVLSAVSAWTLLRCLDPPQSEKLLCERSSILLGFISGRQAIITCCRAWVDNALVSLPHFDLVILIFNFPGLFLLFAGTNAMIVVAASPLPDFRSLLPCSLHPPLLAQDSWFTRTQTRTRPGQRCRLPNMSRLIPHLALSSVGSGLRARTNGWLYSCCC